MNNYKYTTDGRKVVIVGQLNSAETIVQEVFISGDNEIPSGENFVVKSLHDAPVISWKEKKVEEIAANYETTRNKIEHDLKEIRRKFNEEKAICGSLTKAIKTINANGIPESLLQFLRGEITHVVELGYSTYTIRALGESLEGQERYDRELKLMTLFGKSDGGIEWRLNTWSDGSGSNETVLPCTSFDHAREVLSEYIREKSEDGGCDHYMAEAKSKYGLQYPTEERLRVMRENLITAKQKNIEEKKRQIEKVQAEIDKLSQTGENDEQ